MVRKEEDARLMASAQKLSDALEIMVKMFNHKPEQIDPLGAMLAIEKARQTLLDAGRPDPVGGDEW